MRQNSRKGLIILDKENKIVVFQDKKIRRTWFKDEWWFVDIVEALTGSKNPRVYLKNTNGAVMKLSQRGGFNL